MEAPGCNLCTVSLFWFDGARGTLPDNLSDFFCLPRGSKQVAVSMFSLAGAVGRECGNERKDPL